MKSVSIADLRDQVLVFLLEWHFAERAKGRDFYFLIERPDTFFFAVKDRIALTFWQNKSFKDGTYNLGIVIKTDCSVYLDAKRQNKNQKLEKELWDFFGKLKGKWVESQPPTYELLVSKDSDHFLSALESFIINIKPSLDEIVKQYGLPEKELDSSSLYYKTEEFFASSIRPDHFDEMLRSVLLERRPKDAIPSKAKTGLIPETLYSFEVWNFKGIHHTALDGLPPETKWIFLTGQNGFGKSSVLQAIAIALFGINEGTYNLLNTNENPVILADWVIYPDPVRLYRTKYQSNGRKAKVVAYGPGRLISTQTPPPQNRERLQDGSVRSLFDNTHGLLNIEYELITANAYQPEYFKLLTGIFYTLIPELHEIRINKTASPFVEYIEKSNGEGTYQAVTISQLATGFRGILTFVGDMVLRLGAGKKQLNNLADIKGIVIIDEFELHLHPKYQKILPGKLSELFPNVQFIASTHSPIPLLGAPKETVLLKVDRTEEDGVVVEKLDIDISVLQPNAILTSPIFGFRDILAESHDSSTKVRPEARYDLIIENDEMLQQVNEFLTPDRQEQLKKLFKK